MGNQFCWNMARIFIMSNPQLNHLNGCSNNCGSVAWLGDIDRDSQSWTNYTIESTLQIQRQGSGNALAGIIFRVNSISDKWNGGDYYSATITSQSSRGKKVSVNKFFNGYSDLILVPWDIDSYVDYNLRVEVSGNSWIVYVDNVQVLTGSDSSFNAGSIGLRTYQTSALFRNLYVTRNDLSTTTIQPTLTPSLCPSSNPTLSPTKIPTANPSFFPSESPSFNPSSNPTLSPSSSPTMIPTLDPTIFPTPSSSNLLISASL